MDKVDRGDPYYKACLVASTAAGGAAGIISAGASASFTGGTSFAILPEYGAALGLAAGFLACPFLAPKIRNLFEKDLPLDEFAMSEAIGSMSRYASVNNSSDAVKLLVVVRAVSQETKDTKACSSPSVLAQNLLAKYSAA